MSVPVDALSSSGAKVILAASCDENHPPENMIDGNLETFWISTGMFPQEFIIRFAESTNISQVTMNCTNVKNLEIEKSTSDVAANFETVAEREFENAEGGLQTNGIKLGTRATHLRFIITSGYDHFVSVHRVSVEG